MSTWQYVTIGVLVLALTGAGFCLYYQTKAVGRLETENKTLSDTIVAKDQEIFKNNSKILTLQRENHSLSLEKEENAARALKDLTRVQRIAERKGKLYEKLVNQDFRKTQKRLEDLTK